MTTPLEITIYFKDNYKVKEIEYSDDNYCVVQIKHEEKVKKLMEKVGIYDYFCGYTWFKKDEVPEEWYEYDNIPCLDVHGGITFSELIGDYIVYGFDCAHYGDDKNEQLRDPEHILELCREMRREITNAKNNISEWSRTKNRVKQQRI